MHNARYEIMDLSKLNVVEQANSGAALELLHPVTGEVLTDEKKEPKAFYLKLLGSDSDVYRNQIKRNFERNQNQSKGRNKPKLDIDDAQRRAAELLAKCTTECYMIEDGKPIECTSAEMVRLYLKYPWLREQAEEFIGDRGNLMIS